MEAEKWPAQAYGAKATNSLTATSGCTYVPNTATGDGVLNS